MIKGRIEQRDISFNADVENGNGVRFEGSEPSPFALLRYDGGPLNFSYKR